MTELELLRQLVQTQADRITDLENARRVGWAKFYDTDQSAGQLAAQLEEARDQVRWLDRLVGAQDRIAAKAVGQLLADRARLLSLMPVLSRDLRRFAGDDIFGRSSHGVLVHGIQFELDWLTATSAHATESLEQIRAQGRLPIGDDAEHLLQQLTSIDPEEPSP